MQLVAGELPGEALLDPDLTFGSRRASPGSSPATSWQTSRSPRPAGITSQNLDDNRTFWSQLPEKGTYNFFCSLHPVQMHQRVVVKGKKKKKRKSKRKRKRK